ncbi:antitoxin Xre/MbcA/ParS toxin-binding domain-containing protein [Alcanivorax jadensis]|uniref:antitoxin Xre/MbcA/ParS toxin-binding domain-containing protein n=1 Tax=Alcanivorax jadensis TaxID=64988 RepID=UPI0026EDB7BC|nr:antitoxin Xre/MbcA/ParS toxin-binding domain-containing protein [Alcanivorax jadensis]
MTTQKIKISIQNGRMSIYTDFNSPLDQIDLESMKPSNEWCQSHNAYSLRPFVMVKGCSIIIEKNAIPSIESFADWYREQFDNSNSLRNYYTSLQGMKDAQKWRNIMEKKLRNDQVWPLLDLPINSKERENLVLSGLDASIITRMADLIRVEDDKIVSVLHSDKTSKSIPTKGTGLSPAEGEAIIRIANNLITALDVFDGNKNEAVTWLSTPRRIFNGSSPLEMCKTSHDAEQVRILLLRAKHGVFS